MMEPKKNIHVSEATAINDTSSNTRVESVSLQSEFKSLNDLIIQSASQHSEIQTCIHDWFEIVKDRVEISSSTILDEIKKSNIVHEKDVERINNLTFNLKELREQYDDVVDELVEQDKYANKLEIELDSNKLELEIEKKEHENVKNSVELLKRKIEETKIDLILSRGAAGIGWAVVAVLGILEGFGVM